MRIDELDEIEEEARNLLPHRVNLIRDGRIDDTHWFISLVTEAALIVRRRRQFDQRRDA